MARNDDDIRARVASRYLGRTAAKVSLDSRARFAGRGEDEGWTLTISEIYPDRGGYAVEGTLWWQQHKFDREWASFKADLRDRRGKLMFDNLTWVSASGKTWPQMNSTTRLSQRVAKISGWKASQVSLQSLVGELFPASIMGLDGYKGKLTVVPLAGPVREFIPETTLRQFGGHSPYPGAIKALPPEATAEGAVSSAEADKKRYEKSSWPGGMAAVVGLVKWIDAGTWSGLVSSYYSPS